MSGGGCIWAIKRKMVDLDSFLSHASIHLEISFQYRN
jgi:hypothetical protein